MKILIAALVVAGAALTAQPALANVCIRTQDITGTRSDDGKTLIFTLRDGSTRVNHLQGVCTDLKWNGFAWNIRGPEEVCENQQSLTTLQTGQVCTLGKFDAPQMSHEKHAQN